MSASLVGSEMCIRDSAAALGTSRNPLPPQPGASLHGRAAPGRPMAPRACLLYTSDAADDM
eukprot:14454373-Alexandrium_andersonii.AAC.1